MNSKAVALFLSLGLATTVAACAGQPGGPTEGEQTPPASTIEDGGEEGGAPTAPASTTPNPDGTEEGEEGQEDQNDQDGEEGEGGES